MRPVNGGWEDQVPRLQRFRDDHPDITITPPGEHTLMWKARKGDVVIAEHFSLRRLLDALEDMPGC
jgi:hypothetical protein